MVQVLDKGWVTLEDSMPHGPAPAADKKVEKRARVSNLLPSLVQEEIRTITQTQGLINYLVKNKHGSPLEGAIFEFYVKCPLFVRSEWHRHRTWSFSEMSGRYVEYEPEFYIPDKWRIQGATNKQGSLFPQEPITIPTEEGDWQELEVDVWDRWIKQQVEGFTLGAYNQYQYLLSNRVAKEMARMVLPSNLYTAFYGTIDARNLMKFLENRNADNAQFEIRMYAIEVEKIFAEKMPMTYQAFINNGRVAP